MIMRVCEYLGRKGSARSLKRRAAGLHVVCDRTHVRYSLSPREGGSSRQRWYWRTSMSSKDLMFRVQRVAEAAAARKTDATRHKCFVSYHVDDITEVEAFLDDFGTEFIPRSVGVTVEDDFVDSTDEDYIKRRIRELYLTDSTVAIVLLGGCTWARKFVD